MDTNCIKDSYAKSSSEVIGILKTDAAKGLTATEASARLEKVGKNTLKVSVTDTWYNRLVFDAGQPEAKRRTWTIAGPKKGSALRDSGLIGPVRVIRTKFSKPPKLQNSQ